MAVKQIITADGSPTLYVPEMDEHYHSVNGAIREARHVYMDAGLNQCPKTTIRVLEMGFGTGLNAFLTAEEAERRNIQVMYTTLENNPLSDNIVDKLHYAPGKEALFRKIHRVAWGTFVSVTAHFTLQKIRTDFREFTYSGNYDLIYYDAFAPDKQPEVWSQALFDAIYNATNPAGILTTYCAKGLIRRRMQQAGFSVERLPGPPGKREMLRARKLL
jgi:tRNA U34 5-methylaminomethyl-2-thiouridine-forming methyltransferase MnmC